MDVFVIVALAVLVVSIGATVVSGLALYRAVRALTAAAREAAGRIGPLTEELRAEQAVTALELAALQRTRAAGQRAPRGRR